jgi:hypothetical protein
MDGSHFDTLVKLLVTRRLTRGQTLRGLAVSGLAVLTGLRLVAEEVGAKNKGKGKKRRKKTLVCTCSAAGCTSLKVKKPSTVINQNPSCNYAGSCTTNPCGTQTTTTPSTQTPNGCTPSCEQKICGDNGCGGSCGTCEADQVCATGRCASSCPGGQKNCNGTCIPSNQCCTNSDCPVAVPDCCAGTCVNRQTDERHCGSCGVRCTVNEQCDVGVCICGSSVCSTLNPAFSCCAGRNRKICRCFTDAFMDLATCDIVTTCPLGTIPCAATTDNCGGEPARTCCPVGTTCTAGGTCLPT